MIEVYKRYFWVCRFFGDSLISNYFLIKLMQWLSPVFHPQRADKIEWRAVWLNQGIQPEIIDAGWRRYLKNGAVATALLYRISNLSQSIRPKIYDVGGRLDVHRVSGGLILPFHQHFAYHISILLAAKGLKISPITLSPLESPLSSLYEEYAKSWFTESEHGLNGGKWIFTSKSDRGSAREILRQIKLNNVIYSAIDINNIYINSPSEDVLLFNKIISIPRRLVEISLANNLPISCCYMEMDDGGNFSMYLHPLDGSDGVGGVIKNYINILENVLLNNPSLWENWKLLK